MQKDSTNVFNASYTMSRDPSFDRQTAQSQSRRRTREPSWRGWVSLSALYGFGMVGALSGAPSVTAAQSTARTAGDDSSTVGVVNIQTASADELQRLPGIGEAKARAIISRRERRPFRRVEDIMRVKGIGRATFRRLRSMLTVEGPTTLASPRKARPRRTTATE